MSEIARRAIVIVLDGVGVGAAPDASRFGCAGADTLGHVARAAGGLRLPVLEDLGLGAVAPIAGVRRARRPRALAGRLAPRSAAIDSATGHWELMGLVTRDPPPTYPDGFPDEVMEAVTAAWGRGWLCNRPASGTEVIERFGAEHLRTGRPIVYTSADSVFQVAAHEKVVPPGELYALCAAARAILTGRHGVRRVIARPFRGTPGGFERTAGRRDLALPPPGPTALDAVAAAGLPVEGVGKAGQLFAGRGLTRDTPTAGNAEGMAVVAERAAERGGGLVLANLLDFDTRHGHRGDAAGFAACLEEFDRALGELLPSLRSDDLLVITADHGNDPTAPGTDHTREWVPLLLHAPGSDAGRSTWTGRMADLGRSVLDWLGVGAPATLAGRPIPVPAISRRPRT